MLPTVKSLISPCVNLSHQMKLDIKYSCIITLHTEKDHNVVYATPFRQDADSDVIASSSTENQEAETRTDQVVHHRDTSRDVTSTFYSNATASPEPQSDSPVYSTVTFDKDTKYSVATRHTDSVMYSAIKV